MHNFFSIIVPTYNNEAYIEDTINSIIKQDFQDYQLIIIDDGSSDETYNICSELYENNRDKIIFVSTEHRGVSSARNEGLKKATGQYIMFVDGDDYLVKGALNYLHTILCNSHPDLLSFDFVRETSIDDSFSDIDYSKNKIVLSTKELIAIKLNEKTIPCFAFCIKKSIVEVNNIAFDEDLTYVEDALFIFKCMLASKSIMYVNNELYLYLQHPGSATHLGKIPSDIYGMEIKAWKRIRKILSFDKNLKNIVNKRMNGIKEKYYKIKLKEILHIY